MFQGLFAVAGFQVVNLSCPVVRHFYSKMAVALLYLKYQTLSIKSFQDQK